MASILCIEDEVLLREDIMDELQTEGHETLSAENGQQGLALLLKHRPDMVLCDISMPVMNGYELLSEVRENHEDYNDIPFVFLSALADKTEVMEGLNLGADDYLTKPIDFDLLIAKVESVLRHAAFMQKKKTEEQVKLYKALTGATGKEAAPQKTKQAEAAKPLKLSDSFRQKLAFCLDDRGGSAGKLHMIGLENIRKRYAEDWDRVSKRILGIAEKTIRAALDQKDAFERYGDDNFLVLFSGLSKEEGDFKAASIARELVRKLVGEEAVDSGEFAIESTATDLAVLAGGEGAQLDEKLDAAFAREQDGKSPSLVQARELDPQAILRGQLDVSFQALWTASLEQVESFFVLPVRKTAYGCFTGDQVLHGGRHDPFVPVLDRMMLEKAAESLAGHSLAPDEKPSLILPMHFDSLMRSHLEETRIALEEHLPGLSGFHLNAEIMGLSEHASNNRIREAVGILRKYFGKIYLRSDAESLATELFQNTGLDFIGLDFSEHRSATNSQGDMKLFADLAGRAGKTGAVPYILGIDSRAELISVLAAGIKQVAGRQIAEDFERLPARYALHGRRVF